MHWTAYIFYLLILFGVNPHKSMTLKLRFIQQEICFVFPPPTSPLSVSVQPRSVPQEISGLPISGGSIYYYYYLRYTNNQIWKESVKYKLYYFITIHDISLIKWSWSSMFVLKYVDFKNTPKYYYTNYNVIITLSVYLSSWVWWRFARARFTSEIFWKF